MCEGKEKILMCSGKILNIFYFIKILNIISKIYNKQCSILLKIKILQDLRCIKSIFIISQFISVLISRIFIYDFYATRTIVRLFNYYYSITRSMNTVHAFYTRLSVKCGALTPETLERNKF